ncbi:hypothetical protein BaRGS_00014306, partial [Batillaria attramentaria]
MVPESQARFMTGPLSDAELRQNRTRRLEPRLILFMAAVKISQFFHHLIGSLAKPRQTPAYFIFVMFGNH